MIPTRLIPMLCCLVLFGVSAASAFAEQKDAYVVDTASMWRQCAERCQQNDEFGILTRKGCMAGCEMAKQQMPLAGKRFSQLDACLHDVDALDLAAHVDGLQKQCKARWNHLYKRRGCTDAIAAYYAPWSTRLCVLDSPAQADAPGQESGQGLKQSKGQAAEQSAEQATEQGTKE